MLCQHPIGTARTGLQECARVTRAPRPASSFAMRLLIRRCHSSSLHLLNEQREGGERGRKGSKHVAGQISFSPSLTRMRTRTEPDTESGVHARAAPRPDTDSSLPGEDWVT